MNVINRENLIPEDIEAICLEVIKPKSKPILIASVYRPPSKNHSKVIESRDYKSYLQQNVNQDLYAALSVLNWGIDEPNILWDNFKTTYNDVADIHAPTKVRKVRTRKSPWLTDAIKKNMNYRDFLKKKAIKTNSTAFHNAYKSLRNNINKQIIHAKRNYYTNCIERNKNNSKQMWKNIKSSN